MEQQRIPLFPLGVVLLPRMPLPLHIFEERYKEMIARCLEENIPFGVVYASGSKLQSTGCSARVERVLEKYDDGRSDILTLGDRRFHIDRLFEERSYIEAEVSFFSDAPPDGERDRIGELAHAAVDRLEILATLTGHEIERDPLESLDPQSLSFIIGASGVFTFEERQSFLDMRSTERRLSEEVDRLEQSIAQRKMMRDARQTLGLKGDLTHLLN
ncbi:MAG: LON peptidase substrate-binding domain-containing protein [Spirochaetaceae bacterium]